MADVPRANDYFEAAKGMIKTGHTSEYEAAIQYLEQVEATSGSTDRNFIVLLRSKRAEWLLEIRRYQDAIAVAQSALDIIPDRRVPLRIMARAYDALGIRREAKIASIRVADRIRTKNDFSDALISRNYNGAADALIAECRRTDQPAVRILETFGDIIFNMEKRDKNVLRDLTRVVELRLVVKTKDPARLRAVGAVHWISRNFPRAIKVLHEADQIEPNNEITTYLLTCVYPRTSPQRLAASERLCQIRPDFLWYVPLHSSELLREGHIRRAITFLEPVYQRHPTHKQTFLHLAEAYIRNQQYDDADKTLEDKLENTEAAKLYVTSAFIRGHRKTAWQRATHSLKSNRRINPIIVGVMYAIIDSSDMLEVRARKPGIIQWLVKHGATGPVLTEAQTYGRLFLNDKKTILQRIRDASPDDPRPEQSSIYGKSNLEPVDRTAVAILPYSREPLAKAEC